MWTITEIKKRGKAAFRKNYWKAVLVALILGIISGAYSSASSNNSSSDSGYTEYYGDGSVSTFEEYDTGYSLKLGPVSLPLQTFGGVVWGILAIIFLVVRILIVYPLEVGARGFFVKNLRQQASLSELGCGFRGDWLNTVWIMVLRDIKTFLWTLLFIIPGIVKYYEYRLIPYLLAENPDMSSREAFEESRNLMYGQKMNAFLFDLSFIGWHILSAFTFGLVGVFWTYPYKYSSDAALYDRLADYNGGAGYDGFTRYTNPGDYSGYANRGSSSTVDSHFTEGSGTDNGYTGGWNSYSSDSNSGYNNSGSDSFNSSNTGSGDFGNNDFSNSSSGDGGYGPYGK